jgi:hypothetical protein
LDSNGVFTVVVQTATCDYVKIHIVGYILWVADLKFHN